MLSFTNWLYVKFAATVDWCNKYDWLVKAGVVASIFLFGWLYFGNYFGHVLYRQVVHWITSPAVLALAMLGLYPLRKLENNEFFKRFQLQIIARAVSHPVAAIPISTGIIFLIEPANAQHDPLLKSYIDLATWLLAQSFWLWLFHRIWWNWVHVKGLAELIQRYERASELRQREAIEILRRA